MSPRGVFFFLLFFLFIFNPLALEEAFSQEYQKALIVLEASAKGTTNLRGEPSSRSKKLGVISRGGKVQIQGRKGAWYQVRTRLQKRNLKGWVWGKNFTVLGPIGSKSQKRKVAEKKVRRGKPEAILQGNREFEVPDVTIQATSKGFLGTRRNTPKKQYRITPRVGHAFGLKAFPDQYRGGLEFMFAPYHRVELGGIVEMGFKDVTLFVVGPQMAYQPEWPVLFGIEFNILAGVPIYYVSDSVAGSDYFGGVRLGVEAIYAFSKFSSPAVEFRLGAISDAIVFGTSTASMTLTGTAGVSFRF